jgi:outer membrane usher protein
MDYLSFSQASTIKEACKKTSYWLACLFVSVSFITPTVTLANSQLDDEMTSAYKQIFGKAFIKNVKKKLSTKPLKTIQKKAKKITIHDKDPELVAFYNQVFGNKNTQLQAQQATVSEPPLKKLTLVEPLNEYTLEKSKTKQRVESVATATLSQNTNTSALHYQETDTTEEEESEQDNQSVDLNDLFARAFGKKLKAGPSEIKVDLRIDTESLGDVTVYRNEQGRMDRVDTQALLALLEKIIKEHIFKRIEKSIKANKKIRFKKLKVFGIRARYNASELSLDLQAKSNIRKPRILSLNSKIRSSVREENKIEASEISGYINMYSDLGIDPGRGNQANLSMKLEGSLQVGKVVIENDINLNNKKWTTGKTTLTYDEPEKLRRYILGDISTGNKNFQENFSLKGVRMSKEFYMDPASQIRPKGNESFIIESDSEVEVFSNNRLIKRYYLKEGIYSLQDIGLQNGENNIRIKIKDKFGKVTEKTSQQFYDSLLLKPRLSLYAASLGILSDNGVFNDDATNKLIFSGYFQKGLTKSLTMGLDAQISPNSYLLGAESIASISLGSIKNSISISGGQAKNTGYATRFQFKPNQKQDLISLDSIKRDSLDLDIYNKNFVNGWIVSGEHRSNDFLMLNEIESTSVNRKKLRTNLQGQFGFGFGNDWRGSASVGVYDYYNSDTNLFARLSAEKRFTNGMRVGVGASYDSEDKLSMNLRLSIALSRQKQRRDKDLDLSYDSKDKSYESKLSISPLSLFGKDSLSGSLVHQKSDSTQHQKLDLVYNDTHFKTMLTARNNKNLDAGISSQQLNIGFNSSLACIGNKCGVSVPIDDSFAIVTGPSNQEQPIAINNGKGFFSYSDGNSDLPDNYTALIDKKGGKAIVTLESYLYQRINIDEATLPNNYDSEKTEFEVFPRYHQGYLIKAGGEPSVTIDGILIDDEKKPLAYKGGQLIPLKGEGKTIAFFSNKIGRFRVSSLVAGKYKLELFDYSDMETIHINVPDKKGMVHDIGSLMIMK